LLACLLAAVDARGRDPGEYPLLDLASELEKERKPVMRTAPDAPQLKQAEHALQQINPPDDAHCARSIGAEAFADAHATLARARAAVGDYAGAAESYRHAHACRPREEWLLRNLAEVLFDARDFAGARAAANQALAIEPREVFSHRIIGNLEFIAENWAEAVSRYRYVAASDPDRDRAGYGQLMYWLAQKRAGVPEPAFVARRPGTAWPQPLIAYLRGEYTEAELVMPIRDGDDDYSADLHVSTDERLCEALYYVGQAHWANGDVEVARAYFAAVVNLRVTYFIEHGMALAEIAKLNKLASR
jgi:tetratricopeptide (TPR) repeat protein